MISAAVQRLLDRLPSAKPAGPEKHMAYCPCHERDGDGHRRSLSIGIGDGGKVLLHCFGGCATSDILRALNMKDADLFDRPEAAAPQTATSRIVAEYNYLDETGALLFQVVRFQPKDFRQRRPDGNGGWTWDLKGVRRVPYRLPELLKADPAAVVFICEGCKDVDNMVALGLVATCNPGGAGKWLPEYSKFLRGRRVCILADKDAAGRKHARDVARSLQGIAADVRIVEMPDVAGATVKDVSDWIDALDAKDSSDLAKALVAMADAAQPWTPTPEAPAAVDDALADGDVRLGREFAAAFPERVLYCPDLETWLCWDGRRWALDAVHEAERMMQNLTRERLAAAADIGETKRREAEIHFWTQAMRKNRIEAALWAARSDPRLIVRLTDLDADPWLLNVANGTLNLKTGRLHRHDPGDRITKLALAEYRPDADLREWLRFLDRIIPKPEVRAFLPRAVGYSLTGFATEEALFFVCGPTAGGKSTFVAAVTGALGDYAASANFETFLARRTVGGPRSDLVRLAGKRFVSSIETEEAAQLAGGVLKWISGQDRVCERTLYKAEVEFLPTFTLWLVSNFLPRAQDDDSALWRRLMLVEFPVSIPEAERDPNVKMCLRDPAIGGAAVLAWAVAGCREWQKHGLKPPPAVLAATRRWRAENDPLVDWLTDRATLAPTAATPFQDLSRDYRQWAEDAGLKPISARKLGKRLVDAGCKSTPGTGNRTVYEGIALRVNQVND